MAGAGFKTFTAGEVFTASDANTYLMQQAVMVFTNEAARDAAITAPSAGMCAYLTSPTIPASNGSTHSGLNDVLTIYNGSVWVVVTPIGAYTDATGTTTSGTYTATLSGSPGTNPSITTVTGTRALVYFSAFVQNSTQAEVRVSFSVSGATTLAASDVNVARLDQFNGGWGDTVGRAMVVSGLTAGTNTFQMEYKRASSGTLTVISRSLVVTGLM